MSSQEDDLLNVESDLFIGLRAPFWMFDYQLQSLSSVVELPRSYAEREPHLYRDVMRRASEVALVGALGFFEAFCKHQFAALTTIHPRLIDRFASRRPEATIRLSSLIPIAHFDPGVGFALAEQHDFGTGRRINSLFRDLVEVSPLKKSEGDELDAVLRKRHLIVHHGGIHTSESAGLTLPSGRAFQDEVLLEAEEYFEISEFLLQLAVKVATTTVDGLKRCTNDLADVTEERRGAVKLLLRGVWDEVG